MKSLLISNAVLALLIAVATSASASVGDDLFTEFRAPPPSTRPWCFWYWMNDHISREGITRDLESMRDVGIGTALIANIYLDNLPAGPIPVMSPEWLDLTVHAIHEGRRLGIDVGLF